MKDANGEQGLEHGRSFLMVGTGSEVSLGKDGWYRWLRCGAPLGFPLCDIGGILGAAGSMNLGYHMLDAIPAWPKNR